MSPRELVVLGTASQVPTRERNHNGYLLRWGRHGILFDPGEGTQRQFSMAGLSTSLIDRICITHFHGDHCLGLPGVLLRLSMDRTERPIPLHHPAGGEVHLARLRTATAGRDRVDLRPAPVHADGEVARTDEYVLWAAALDHVVPTVGYRVEDPPGRSLMPERLASLGLTGAAIGELRETGRVSVAGRTVELDEVSEERHPASMAFVMDTRWCAGALALARNADLLVCEATFCDADAELAHEAGHLTGRQAGRLAAEAGARRLVLTHFSARYPDQRRLLAEARAEFAATVVANDLDRIPVSPGRSS